MPYKTSLKYAVPASLSVIVFIDHITFSFQLVATRSFFFFFLTFMIRHLIHEEFHFHISTALFYLFNLVSLICST